VHNNFFVSSEVWSGCTTISRCCDTNMETGRSNRLFDGRELGIVSSAPYASVGIHSRANQSWLFVCAFVFHIMRVCLIAGNGSHKHWTSSCNEWMNEWMNECMNERTNEWMINWNKIDVAYVWSHVCLYGDKTDTDEDRTDLKSEQTVPRNGPLQWTRSHSPQHTQCPSPLVCLAATSLYQLSKSYPKENKIYFFSLNEMLLSLLFLIVIKHLLIGWFIAIKDWVSVWQPDWIESLRSTPSCL